MAVHEFSPVYTKNSQVLILGTFPSVKSREAGFYYYHPQNRFWKLMGWIANEEVPEGIEEKKKLLNQHGIAIWDVIESCDITGSSDSSIRNVVSTDLKQILEHAPIKQIFANGNKAYELYQKYSYPDIKRDIRKLPSTSPANAAFTMDRLKESWGAVKEFL